MKNYKEYVPKSAGLTVADHKFIVAHTEPQMDDTNGMIFNMFSGDTRIVNPLIKALVDCVYELSEHNFAPDILSRYGFTERNRISKFDRARMIVMKLDSGVYMNFID